MFPRVIFGRGWKAQFDWPEIKNIKLHTVLFGIVIQRDTACVPQSSGPALHACFECRLIVALYQQLELTVARSSAATTEHPFKLLSQ
jgi:hypothetical protein